MAEAMADLAQPGDVVLLVGDLGTGKTTFAQGFGAGLGITEPITSPTFVLVRPYRGRLELIHADMYRLDHLAEVVDLGLPELLEEGAVALVEWGDVAAAALAPDFLQVRFEAGGQDGGGQDGGVQAARGPVAGASAGERWISLEGTGGRWRQRWPALELAVLPWRWPKQPDDPPGRGSAR